MGKYTFLVNKSANKTQIKKAIEEVFDVKVVEIKTNITKGTEIRNTRVRRIFSQFSNKKARVILSAGQTIAIFDEHLGNDDKKKGKKEDKKDDSKKKIENSKKEEKIAK